MTEPNDNPRTAIVTGAGGAIGSAIVSALVDTGWAVVAMDRTPELLARWDASSSVAPLVVDFAAAEMVASAFDGDQFPAKKIHAIVNNAGIQGGCPIRDQSLADWNMFHLVNVTGPWLVAKHALSRLVPNASIVNVGSVASVAGFSGRAAYCASKHALLGLTRALAAELAPIRVNLLMLGSIDTPSLPKRSDDPQRDRQFYAGRQLLDRLGTVKEAASAVEFLLSDKAGFMTGSILNLDGGMLVKGALG